MIRIKGLFEKNYYEFPNYGEKYGDCYLTVKFVDEVKIEGESFKITLMDHEYLNEEKKKADHVKIDISKGTIIKLEYRKMIPIHARIEEGSELYINIYGVFGKANKNKLIKSRGKEWLWIDNFEEYSEDEWLIKDILE